MHPSAYQLGSTFLARNGGGGRRILEVGSANVNGSLRPLCPEGSEWVGVDRQPGPGVDVVVRSEELPAWLAGHFHLVLSSSCVEHDPCFWVTFLSMLDMLVPSGLLYINAPAKGPYHAHPVDCWRLFPDSGRALEAWGQRQGYDVHLLEAFAAGTSEQEWIDTVFVFSRGKPPEGYVPLVDSLSASEKARP